MKDYPLIKFVIAFAIGLILTSFISILLPLQLILLGSFLILSLVFYLIPKDFTKVIASYIMLISVCVVGMVSLTSSQLDKPEYPFKELFERDVLIDGRVEEIELPSDNLVLKINVERTLKNKKLVEEKYNTLCRLNYDKPIIDNILKKLRPGNRVVILGNLQIPPNERNPGEFDYREYLRDKNIPVIFTSYNPLDFVIVDYQESYISSKIFEVRYAIAKQIKKIYNDKTSGLLKGLLLADRSEIGYDVKEGFIKSGVIHVLAVSGLHVGFIVLILLFLLGRFNIYFRIGFTILGLIAFMIITGMPPSVTRATIMAVLLLISYLRSNKQNNFNTLTLAAFLILIFDPTQIFNPGFQLSFSAVISIFVFFPRFRNLINTYFKVHPVIRYLLLFLSVSLAAQLGTLPFTIYYFGKLSLVSLFANIVIIPLIGFIVGLGIFTLFVSLIPISITHLFIIANEAWVDLAFSFVKYVSSFSFAYLSIPNYSVWDGVIYLIMLTIFILYFRKIISFKTKFVFTLLVLSNLVIWSKIDNTELLPDDKLSVLFLDVGKSESALVKFPNNKTAMINFGNASTNYSAGKYTIMPLLNRLGIDKIDYGIISHLNRDKYLGVLDLIENDLIDTLLIPQIYGADREHKLLNNYLSDQDVFVKVIEKDVISFKNSRLYSLLPKLDSKYSFFNIFNRSAPAKLIYGNTSILFCGGLERRGEEVLTNGYSKFLQSDILQVANYGSDVSTSIEFIENVKPKYSIISAGLGNYLEYPSSGVIDLIGKEESKLFRTDKDGAILFISDGENIEFVDWRSY